MYEHQHVHFILEPLVRNVIVCNINDENLCVWLLLDILFESTVVTRSKKNYLTDGFCTFIILNPYGFGTDSPLYVNDDNQP